MASMRGAQTQRHNPLQAHERVVLDPETGGLAGHNALPVLLRYESWRPQGRSNRAYSLPFPRVFNNPASFPPLRNALRRNE